MTIETSAGRCEFRFSRFSPGTSLIPHLPLVNIPQHSASITINGHQAKILPVDFTVGSKTLVYSTAEVLSFSIQDGKEILALWLPEGEAGEFMIKNAAGAKLISGDELKSFASSPSDGSVVVSYVQENGMYVVGIDDGTRVLLLDRQAAYRFWVPELDNNPLTYGENTGKFSPDIRC